MRIFVLFTVALLVLLATVTAETKDKTNKKLLLKKSMKKSVQSVLKKAAASKATSPKKNLRKSEQKSFFSRGKKNAESYIEVTANGNAARTKSHFLATNYMVVSTLHEDEDCDATYPYYFGAAAVNECTPGDESSDEKAFSAMFLRNKNTRSGATSYSHLYFMYSDNTCIDSDSVEVDSLSGDYYDTCIPSGNGESSSLLDLSREDIDAFLPDQGVVGLAMRYYQNSKSCHEKKTKNLGFYEYFENDKCIVDDETMTGTKYSCAGDGSITATFYSDVTCTTVDVNNPAVTITAAEGVDSCDGEAPFFRNDCITGV